MLYRTIVNRRTVSALCLGAMNFGSTTSPETATAILDRFVAAGGTFIDTANNYNHLRQRWRERGTAGRLDACSGKSRPVGHCHEVWCQDDEAG